MARFRMPAQVFHALASWPSILTHVQRTLGLPGQVTGVSFEGNEAILALAVPGFADDDAVDVRVVNGLPAVVKAEPPAATEPDPEQLSPGA